MDWVTQQAWSNGLIGSTGISYEGIAAEFLAVAQPSATHVVIPQEADIDQYAQWLFPGGIPNALFIDWWQQTNNALDRGRIPADWGGLLARLTLKGVRPVDEDKDRTLLKRAIAEHKENGDMSSYARGVTYRDDLLGSTGVTLDDLSITSYLEQVEASGAAIFSWGSWMDGSTADGVLQRSRRTRTPSAPS